MLPPPHLPILVTKMVTGVKTHQAFLANCLHIEIPGTGKASCGVQGRCVVYLHRCFTGSEPCWGERERFLSPYLQKSQPEWNKRLKSQDTVSPALGWPLL